MLDQLCTFTVFIVTTAMMPGLILCYIGVRVSKRAWLHILSMVHPDVDFIQDTTVRTLVDTRRNQGIFTVLLRIEGEPRVDLVRRHLQEVVTRVDKLGNTRFPKLSKLLVIRWSSYAWEQYPQGKEFNVDQVLVVGGRSTHRGRPLTESNVREHVSDIVTRYLPKNCPPWQLVVLPCAGSSSHYLLLRMHHLLLTDGDINIADLLPFAIAPESSTEEFTTTTQRHRIDSPLLQVVQSPQHIRHSYEALIENLTNRWNEFTFNYDPLHKPELLKTTPYLASYMATVLVALVAIVRRIWFGCKNVTPEFSSRLRYVRACIRHEFMTRRIEFMTAFRSVFVTLFPWNITYIGVNTFIWFAWNIPRQCLYEMRTIYARCNKRRLDLNPTLTDLVCDSAPLVYRAVEEVFQWLNAVYRAPRLLADELLKSRGWPGGTPVPLCGRKVVSWSKPVSGQKLRDISRVTGLSCTEVLLTALGGALTDYYQASGVALPSRVPITARLISSGYLYSSGPNIRPQDAVSGMLCLQLPTLEPSPTSYIENMSYISRNVAIAKRYQSFVYLISILQTKHRIVTRALPSVLVTVILKYLSKKYTISVTELMAGDGGEEIRKTTWGQRVTNIIYWRPPQANISVSLCLNYYGDEVTLAVMSDALISPHHMPLADALPVHVDALARATGLK